MDLEPGFKLSEVGPIPEDWEALRFRELFDIWAGGDLEWSRSSPVRSPEHRFPVYANSQEREGLHSFASYSTEPANSTTVTARGGLGFAAFRDHPYVAIGRLLVLAPRSGTSARFYADYINARHTFAPENTSIAQLTAPQIGSEYCAVPTPAEQRAIAEVLKDADGWIAAAEAEAAKLAQVRAAAMEALLTPTTRLRGFTGEWERLPLGELYEPLSTVAVARAAYTNGGGIACVHYGDIHVRYDGFVDVSRDYVPTLPPHLVRSATRLRCGDVLIADAAEDLEGVGKAVELVATAATEIVGGLHIQALRQRNDRVALGFAGYLFQQQAYRQAVERAASGLKVFGISKSQLGMLEVLLPPTLAEQRAIAALLADMDAAVAAARAVVEKMRGVKAAAMEGLLSGRVRLPPFGPRAQPAEAAA